MEGFEFYISSNGYLVIPKYDIRYLIDVTESVIPSMPEATEVAAKIAGRDGDVVLATSYEPISFEIVCYTEDNLSAEEKRKSEAIINKFINEMKQNTKRLGIEQEEKFYDVKYSGNLTVTRFPKCLKYSIPLKASNPFAKFFKKRAVVGNATFDSDTIKEVGGIFTITGPATDPKLSLNNYQMEYEETILDGNKLIIDSGNSTVTLISENSETHEIIKTNAMRYYNHQFPKVENGNNTLVVNSGVADENVTLEWYDLML